MKVHEVMSSPVITVREDATLKTVVEIMLDHHILGLPVINAFGDLVGMVTESDFVIRELDAPRSAFEIPRLLECCPRSEEVGNLYGTVLTVKAGEVMTSPVITVTEQDPIEHVIKLMLNHDLSRIPVLRGKIAVGIVTCHDLLELLARKCGQENAHDQVLETTA